MALSDLSDLFHAMLVLPFLAGSFAAGLVVQRRLPEIHRGPKTHEMLRVVMEMLVTFAAIVLGLLITTSKAAFDGVETELRSFAVDIISTDQTLQGYGPQAAPLRAMLVRYTTDALAQARVPHQHPTMSSGSRLLDSIETGVLHLSPATAMQSHLQQVALQQLAALQQARHRINDEAQAEANLAFYAMLSIWMMVVYGCFGLISEHTWLGSTVVGMSMMAVVLALFVIFEMDSPFTGLITISYGPLTDALRSIGAG